MSNLRLARQKTQIVIMGSGLPGSVMALVLARLGYDVVVIDKSHHPRFTIGESSTPIADAYLALIADRFGIPELKPLSTFAKTRIAYPDLTVGRKRGFSYFWHTKHTPFSPGPNHENEMVVAASANDEFADSHWLRSEVDHRLVSWFECYGVQFLDSCEILSIQKAGANWHLDLNRESTPITLTAKYFVDASGSAGVGVKSQCGKSRRKEMWTDTSACFAHFNGLRRWSEIHSGDCTNDHPFVCDDAAVHHLIRDGWMWQLRFSTGLTSCGIVQCNSRLPKCCTEFRDPQKALHYFRSTLAEYPTLKKQFSDAKNVTPPTGVFYRHRLQHWFGCGSGKNWCALPNTVGFVDPLHSKGLAHSLSGIYRMGILFAGANPALPNEFDQVVAQLALTFQDEIQMLDRLIAICYLSLDNFELFRLATLWYFAAATQFEHRFSEMQEGNSSFLLADHIDFQDRLLTYAEFLKTTFIPGPNSSQPAVATEEAGRLARKLLHPYDRIGLFDPPVNNMYANTSAPERVKSL